jgi:plasmid stabilization system protein ParE
LAQVILAQRAQSNLDRLVDFLAADDPTAAVQALNLILDAIAVLERHPQIGRPVEENLRELVISRGRSGYVALYRYHEPDDLVVVLALRHQREAGYPGQ